MHRAPHSPNFTALLKIPDFPLSRAVGEAHGITTRGIFSGFGKTGAAATECFGIAADVTHWHCSTAHSHIWLRLSLLRQSYFSLSPLPLELQDQMCLRLHKTLAWKIWVL